MAGICNACVETETAKPVEPSSVSVRRRKTEIQNFRFFAPDVAVAPPTLERGMIKRQKFEIVPKSVDEIKVSGNNDSDSKSLNDCGNLSSSASLGVESPSFVAEPPKFGMTSACGRRRDMEDAVAIHPSFTNKTNENQNSLHFYGVYDGHGCSHVAMKCKDRMHEIVKDELEIDGGYRRSWEEMMTTSFYRMDKEITEWSSSAAAGVISSPCRCALRPPQCEAVGSTAVVAVVTPEKIIVSNCGDSRAVLCRNGIAIPLSVDHKPDRPDELTRIEAAGGKVIYWDGARVLGVLAMSRAIGDNYLKPYVVSEPEVAITDRSSGDECLILASDGLWDVVSNETACSVARVCFQVYDKISSTPGNGVSGGGGENSDMDKACHDASILLTRLALARHSADNVSVVVVDLRKKNVVVK